MITAIFKLWQQIQNLIKPPSFTFYMLSIPDFEFKDR